MWATQSVLFSGGITQHLCTCGFRRFVYGSGGWLPRRWLQPP